jgi:hypothetical protein
MISAGASGARMSTIAITENKYNHTKVNGH